MKRALASKVSKRIRRPQTPSRQNVRVDPAGSDLAVKREPLSEDDRWRRDMATLRKGAMEMALRRSTLARPVALREVQVPIQPPPKVEDSSVALRTMSVRTLYELDPERAASLFNIALREGSPQERREIGAALADSGVVEEAITNLLEGSRDNYYGELSVLFLVAKAGQVQPLLRLIERHPDMDLRLAIIRLLASSGGPEVLSAFRRLTVSGSLATEVRVTLLEAINQMTTNH